VLVAPKPFYDAAQVGVKPFYDAAQVGVKPFYDAAQVGISAAPEQARGRRLLGEALAMNTQPLWWTTKTEKPPSVESHKIPISIHNTSSWRFGRKISPHTPRQDGDRARQSAC